MKRSGIVKKLVCASLGLLLAAAGALWVSCSDDDDSGSSSGGSDDDTSVETVSGTLTASTSSGSGYEGSVSLTAPDDVTQIDITVTYGSSASSSDTVCIYLGSWAWQVNFGANSVSEGGTATLTITGSGTSCDGWLYDITNSTSSTTLTLSDITSTYSGAFTLYIWSSTSQTLSYKVTYTYDEDSDDDSSSGDSSSGGSSGGGSSSSGSSSSDDIVLYPSDATLDDDFMYGFDASMVSQLEECGATFSDTDGEEGDIFEILADHGFNWARLRIWVDPEDDAQGDNDYDRTLAMAKRIKAAGLKFLLDFHYSDTWADPSDQHRPASWDDVTALGSASDTDASTSSLCGTVYAYTYEVLKGLYDEGYAPDMVQLGNEINSGMLTTNSDGTTTASPSCSSDSSTSSNLVAVLQAAAYAVDAVDSSIDKMIHLASSSGDNLQWWFSRMDEIDYDYIGLSWYPYYSHGTLANLRTYLAALKSTYNKEVLVVETSWGWSFEEWSDNTSNEFWYDDGVTAASNLVDSSNTLLQYLETETYSGSDCISASYQNQATIARAIVEAVATAGGCGVFYWGGDWIPDGNNQIADNWENQTLFDFDGVALPSIDMFGEANTDGSNTSTDDDDDDDEEENSSSSTDGTSFSFSGYTQDTSVSSLSSSLQSLSSAKGASTGVVIIATVTSTGSEWVGVYSNSSWYYQTAFLQNKAGTGTYALVITSSGATVYSGVSYTSGETSFTYTSSWYAYYDAAGNGWSASTSTEGVDMLSVYSSGLYIAGENATLDAVYYK